MSCNEETKTIKILFVATNFNENHHEVPFSTAGPFFARREMIIGPTLGCSITTQYQHCLQNFVKLSLFTFTGKSELGNSYVDLSSYKVPDT